MIWDNLIPPTTTHATKPIKNIKEPTTPKKCIGFLPNVERNHKERRSK